MNDLADKHISYLTELCSQSSEHMKELKDIDTVSEEILLMNNNCSNNNDKQCSTWT